MGQEGIGVVGEGEDIQPRENLSSKKTVESALFIADDDIFGTCKQVLQRLLCIPQLSPQQHGDWSV